MVMGNEVLHIRSEWRGVSAVCTTNREAAACAGTYYRMNIFIYHYERVHHLEGIYMMGEIQLVVYSVKEDNIHSCLPRSG